ncbi:MAG: hydantoinase B/oxoprolinase family protein, partial [Luminiphilus sp.]
RYGVVMNADLTVNEKRTATLRKKMADKRGKVPMFDRGGDIDTLKKRCLKETGLEPPRQPEFQTWALKLLEGGKGAGGSAAKKSARKPASKAKAKGRARKAASS